MYFSSDEMRWINRIQKLHSMHPDEVVILAQPDTNDGCIYASLPVKWLRVVPPPPPMSEERRAVAAERLRSLRHTIKGG